MEDVELRQQFHIQQQFEFMQDKFQADLLHRVQVLGTKVNKPQGNGH